RHHAGVQGRHLAGEGAGRRLRVPGAGLPLAQRRRPARHRLALQPLPLLPYGPQGGRPMKQQRPNTNGPRATLPLVRCAVYTRKSTEEGLEQAFNSLDAQREAAEAFVKSQAGEGWSLLPERYDDGGFTGGNMDRPALQRLMADIE